MKFWSWAIIVGGVAYFMSQAADARNMSTRPAPFSDRQMVIYGVAEAPIGYTQFCAENATDCRGRGQSAAEVILTDAKWTELQSINVEVNQTVKPLSDQAQYKTIERWAYPASGKGDCEDYVLLKIRRLMERGWPQSVLLITVVRDENGEGHAVLTVRTSRGDLILDNKNSRIAAWSETPYQYIKRQSAVDPRRWNSLIPMREVPTVAASGTEAQ